MKRRPMLITFCFVALLLFGVTAHAKVSQEEAAKLGKELTPLGAIQAGNAEGTIPPWEGGIKTPPANYKPGMHHPDPYAADKILFKITAQNADQYAEKLSPGQVALLKRYPDTWWMNVYPSRRSAAYPERIYEAAIKNATMAELTGGGNGVKNAAEAIPFPIPKEGVEAVWNHLLRYRGLAVSQVFAQVAPTAGGQYTIVSIDQKILFPYSQPGATIESINNRALYFLQTVVAPARLAGQLLLVHDTVDQVKEPRQAWIYNPGQRRVRRAPNVAYDNPGTASDGQRTSDQLDMFNGAPDRYDWKLVGKKEMYVPYNCYKLHSDALKYSDILQPGHINPEDVRYELHRVWVVDATLKKGTSHIYGRRTFFIDEDSWSILVADHYDTRGQIWRVAEAYTINYYENPLTFSTMEANYDLQNGRYIVVGATNEGNPADFNVKLTVDEFTPASVRRMGRR
jgi:hypothetical protein